MGDAAEVWQLEAVCRIPLERRAGEDLRPGGGEQLFRGRVAVDGAGVERAGLGVVAAEVGGVDDDAARHAGQAEADDRPVVPRLAAAPRLPAVHPLADDGVPPLDEDGGRGFQEVLLGREEFVVRRQHGAAQALRREVHEVGEVDRRHRRTGRPIGGPGNVPPS